MSKIVKKKDLDVLIESTLKRAGIGVIAKEEVITETKEVITESKEIINEDVKRELERFNKLTNFNYKY